MNSRKILDEIKALSEEEKRNIMLEAISTLSNREKEILNLK